MIFVAENSTKFQKTKFWKEKSVEDLLTLRPSANATLVANEATTLSSKVFFPLKCHKISASKKHKRIFCCKFFVKIFFWAKSFYK
jgi:hypothetical protein